VGFGTRVRSLAGRGARRGPRGHRDWDSEDSESLRKQKIDIQEEIRALRGEIASLTALLGTVRRDADERELTEIAATRRVLTTERAAEEGNRVFCGSKRLEALRDEMAGVDSLLEEYRFSYSEDVLAKMRDTISVQRTEVQDLSQGLDRFDFAHRAALEDLEGEGMFQGGADVSEPGPGHQGPPPAVVGGRGGARGAAGGGREAEGRASMDW